METVGSWYIGTEITQLVAALPGVWAISTVDGEQYREQVMFWALDGEGEVYPIALTHDGRLGRPDVESKLDSFRIEYEGG